MIADIIAQVPSAVISVQSDNVTYDLPDVKSTDWFAGAVNAAAGPKMPLLNL